MFEFTWIASFPKSGNTWLRYMAAGLLRDTVDGDFDVSANIPDIHVWSGGLTYQWQGAYLAKTHFLPTTVPKRMETRSAIYMVRHPLDVVVSSARYFAPEDDSKCAEVIEEFCTFGGVPSWEEIGYGRWGENVAAWTAPDLPFPVLVMRYEDMLADPHGGARSIAEFLGLTVSDDDIDRAVQDSSFDSMRKIEDEERAGVREAGFFSYEQSFEKTGFRFMRSGKAGGWRDLVSPEQAARLKARNPELFDRFGYDID